MTSTVKAQCKARGIVTNSLYYNVVDCSTWTACNNTWYLKFVGDCDESDFCALPIELVEFQVENDGIENNLYWRTMTEINNDYFTIEHSIDAINWVIIDRVDGSGNSSQIIDYYYSHNNVPVGVSYYRLTQFDFDGKHEMFNVVSCTRVDNEKDIEYIKYFNNLGEEIPKPRYGFYIEVTTYVDKTSSVDKHFIIKK